MDGRDDQTRSTQENTMTEASTQSHDMPHAKARRERVYIFDTT